MKIYPINIIVFFSILFYSTSAYSQSSASDPVRISDISVNHDEGNWIIVGEKQKVTLSESNFTMKVKTGPVEWQMLPTNNKDLRVKYKDEEFNLSLMDAGEINIEKYNTGYKTGIKIRLSRFYSNGMYHKGNNLDLALVLTIALEGENEDLVCTAVSIGNKATVRHLEWPKALDASDVEYTVLPHVRGNLLPGDWPERYHPFGSNVPSDDQNQFSDTETSYIQSNLIETWSMSWWGFQKEQAGMMLIVETPEDAAYIFHHPPGGPTVIGPKWLASLGKLRYPRSVRMCFFDKGNYVTMAKRYRKYVKNIGQFVSLREKIARDSLVAKLIGAPYKRMHILRNISKTSHRYDKKNPENNYRLTTFAESAQELRDLKAGGIDNVFVTLAGWPKLGYDRQHPDVLPPAPDAGGWEGLRKWTETAEELGYLYSLHDQYRDYYVDAPSYDSQFALHEEDIESSPTIFPGTRFGTWKEGHLAFMNYWDGGKLTYLNPRFALGHLRKNYKIIFQHGIKPDGDYLDVFGYVPPTEDFNPEHPLSRKENMKYRALMFDWVRNNLGVVGTEDGADWVIPYVDYTTQANAGATIPVPLYNLVYHDAVFTPSGGTIDFLRCLLNGGYPTVPNNIKDKQEMRKMRVISALHKRVALLEMTNFVYLNENNTKARSTFSDGTTVTVNKDKGTYKIVPSLDLLDNK